METNDIYHAIAGLVTTGDPIRFVTDHFVSDALPIDPIYRLRRNETATVGENTRYRPGLTDHRFPCNRAQVRGQVRDFLCREFDLVGRLGQVPPGGLDDRPPERLTALLVGNQRTGSRQPRR